MTTLYVDTQGSMVRKRDNQVIVTKDGKTLDEVPLAKLDQVVLMGRGVQISTALLVDLLGKGIPVSITNQQGSRLYASLAPGVSRFGALRSQQMALIYAPQRALELAQDMIAAKIANQRALLARSSWPAAPAAIGQIDGVLQSLAAATTIDMVRGYEGAAAAIYFGAWRLNLPSSWGFGGRSFYPPPDPVNAMLSFGYTLALNEIMAVVQIIGLDQYIGVFHVIEVGRPSLALDLLEEFRPALIDRLVLDLLASGTITSAHFERPAQRPDAVYLTQEGRTLLVDRYETLLLEQVALPDGRHTTWRQVFVMQAQALARVIRGEQARYVGFHMR